MQLAQITLLGLSLTTVIGPDCLEMTLRAWDIDRRLIAELPIRVERTDKKPAPSEPLAK